MADSTRRSQTGRSQTRQPQTPQPQTSLRRSRCGGGPRRLACLVLLGSTLWLGGCVLFDPPKPTRPEALNLNRETPRATYEYFKEMARNNQWAAEWSTFSPNFKRLLNQSVGRNVDSGDYNLARQTIADNSQADMQLLINSTYQSAQLVGENGAVITISAGGRTLRPRMVKLTRWELKIRGDDTPYGDYIARASDAVRIGPDGSISVMIRPPQGTASLLRTFRPDQIEEFRVDAQWYVDDFGGIDQLVVERSSQPQGQPQPGTQPGRGRSLPQPPAPQGIGSPDGPTSGTGSPDGPAGGWGSPDG